MHVVRSAMTFYRTLLFFLISEIIVIGLGSVQRYQVPKRRFESIRPRDTDAPTCRAAGKTGPDPDVFWINLDKSYERRKVFERELHSVGLLAGASRIRALTPQMVVVPDQLKVPFECRTVDEKDYLTWPDFKKRPNGRVFIDGLCGRPRNSKKELTVTASHLNALRTAVNSGSESSYALILEDDLEFAFDIDFHALAASAPPGFAILQLVTSNDGNLQYLWKKYWKSTSTKNKFLWEERSDVTDFWCAGAYLINKEVLRPIIEQIVRRVTTSGWIAMRVIAGYDCKPAYCCETHNPDTGEKNVLRNAFDFVNKTAYTSRSNLLNPACVRAPRGFQADHYVFELARPHAYTFSIPLFRDSTLGVGNMSTVHQEQVQWHAPAFASIIEIQKELDAGQVELPSFVKSCLGGHWSANYTFEELQGEVRGDRNAEEKPSLAQLEAVEDSTL